MFQLKVAGFKKINLSVLIKVLTSRSRLEKYIKKYRFPFLKNGNQGDTT